MEFRLRYLLIWIQFNFCFVLLITFEQFGAVAWPQSLEAWSSGGRTLAEILIWEGKYEVILHQQWAWQNHQEFHLNFHEFNCVVTSEFCKSSLLLPILIRLFIIKGSFYIVHELICVMPQISRFSFASAYYKHEKSLIH